MRLPETAKTTFTRDNGESLVVDLRPGRNDHERTIGELHWTKR